MPGGWEAFAPRKLWPTIQGIRPSSHLERVKERPPMLCVLCKLPAYGCPTQKSLVDVASRWTAQGRQDSKLCDKSNLSDQDSPQGSDTSLHGSTPPRALEMQFLVRVYAKSLFKHTEPLFRMAGVMQSDCSNHFGSRCQVQLTARCRSGACWIGESLEAQVLLLCLVLQLCDGWVMKLMTEVTK